MNRAWIVEDGTAREVDRARAEAAVGSADFVWLHLARNGGALPTLPERVPEAAATVLQMEETRPATDRLGEAMLLNLRGPGVDTDYMDLLVSVRLFAVRGFVLTMSYRAMPAIDAVVEEMRRGAIHDPGDLVAALANAITDRLDPIIAGIGDRLDDLESAIAAEDEPHRREVAKVRSEAIRYRRFVAPQRVALERLTEADCDWLDEADRQKLRLAADRAARMAEELEAIRERAAIAHEELTDLRAERIDRRSLTISVAAMIFLPLTFITGLWGMNVGVPWEGQIVGFWIILAASLAIAAGIAGWFWYRHWLDR